ncbi:hypothetical protein SAMN02745975_03613 [Geosporobacter subterraneus DSM 17957]|uniref:Uncharacterized protein n=1 Tax=Geosporobacter subterraneus DSM 17957 TaxID=1121919 RepID=A0A1M6PL80_9FIRM|nr:hypothetical protein [Geosporobacter subterraneus]SHK08689.1 hypothetical protein SAMN02745975_03613 [Geosporobacter subterraneus DSM 17957]
MYDFSKIRISRASTKELIVENNTNYPMIDKGAHGAVFQISEDKCTKIYLDKTNCDLESTAYKKAQDSSIVPRLYEVGENYIVMEY